MDLPQLRETALRLKQQVQQVVVGHENALELMLVSLLCEGHILLEGVPGVAKTLLARTFSASLSLSFNRIQFTPDLMPGDVIGTNLFNFQTNQFVLTKGAIFTELLLADEINRTPPKTQAALLQAMQERLITIDGKNYPLSPAFMVIATQNPFEQEGTYPLPEAQLDRFLFKVTVDFPSRDQERAIVRAHGHRTAMPNVGEFNFQPVADAGALTEMRRILSHIRIADEVIDYIVDLVRSTREHSALQYGASPRASNMLASASRAYAALCGRDFVIPDDVKRLLLPALRHRVLLAPGAELEGSTPTQVLREIVQRVPAPR